MLKNILFTKERSSNNKKPLRRGRREDREKRVLKCALVRIAAFCCANRPQIWIPEKKYYQKDPSHAQNGHQGAEIDQNKLVTDPPGQNFPLKP